MQDRTNLIVSAFATFALLVFSQFTVLAINSPSGLQGHLDSRQSGASPPAVGYGLLHVTILERNESNNYEKALLPVAIREADAPLGYPVMLYALATAVLTARIPAGVNYTVEVLHPFLTASAKVHVMQDKLTNLTIRIDETVRKVTFFELQSSSSLGSVRHSNVIFMRTSSFERAPNWNSTILQISPLTASVDRGSNGDAMVRDVNVSVIRVEGTGKYVVIELRPAAQLSLAQPSSLRFLALSWRFEVEYPSTPSQVPAEVSGPVQIS